MNRQAKPQQGQYHGMAKRLDEIDSALAAAASDARCAWSEGHPILRGLRELQGRAAKLRRRNDLNCLRDHGVFPHQADAFVMLGGVDRADLEAVYDGQRWGPWQYKRETLVLDYKNGQYEVDLERCNSSAEVLDWIAQVAAKAFVTEADLGHLVRALGDLAGSLQSKVCGLGQDHQFDFGEHLRKVTRPEPEAVPVAQE